MSLLDCIRTFCWAVLCCGILLPACSSSDGQAAPDDGGVPAVVEGVCVIAGDGDTPEFIRSVGCTPDFNALASEPLDVTLPGARSVKVVLDQADSDSLYFQNSVLYQVHYEFVSTHLSGNGLPVVPSLADFNATEYYSPDRRFLLGAVTHYEGPQVWALEIAPYDTASVDMIVRLYHAVQARTFFGPALYFHPTSDAVKTLAEGLPSDVRIITTEELYASIDYQPLTLASAIGRLHFAQAEELDTEYVSFQDILVLDQAPNDISVIQGLITEQFQTPLSHVNVLSQNRHTPNMGLRGAMTDSRLRDLEGQLVKLTVEASSWTIAPSTQEDADAFWEANKPEPVELPAMDLGVQGLYDIEDVTAVSLDGDLRGAIKTAVEAFGGKAAHYSVLARIAGVPVRKGFAIPVYYYDRFMRDNGFYDRVDGLVADEQFLSDATVRGAGLESLRADMMTAPVDQGLQDLLQAKIAAEYPGGKMRFRTSTNSEDLDGFPCAGCYESHTGDPADWTDVLDAIRETWASAWLLRTFDERTWYGIDHKSVGMALLVHHNFPDEEANGVAVTSNPFDATGLDPAFYVNVQYGGDVEVVAPPAGVTSDEFLYYFGSPNQPVSYITHSSLVPEGSTVLTTSQIHELGVALDAVHTAFSEAYGPGSGNSGWYAMDVEFKFDDDEAPGQVPALYVKQARPYPGRGTE